MSEPFVKFNEMKPEVLENSLNSCKGEKSSLSFPWK